MTQNDIVLISESPAGQLLWASAELRYASPSECGGTAPSGGKSLGFGAKSLSRARPGTRLPGGQNL